jgi:hypothetical protein
MSGRASVTWSGLVTLMSFQALPSARPESLTWTAMTDPRGSSVAWRTVSPGKRATDFGEMTKAGWIEPRAAWSAASAEVCRPTVSGRL